MADGTWTYPFGDVNSAVSNGNQIVQEFGACSTNSAGDLHLVQTKTKYNGCNGMGNVERL